MKKLMGILLIAAGLAAGVMASPVDPSFAAEDPAFGLVRVETSTGSLLPLGNVVGWGNFGVLDPSTLTSGGVTPAELATLEGAFESIALWAIGDGNGVNGEDAGEYFFTTQIPHATATSFANELTYLLVANVASIGALDSATEFGLIRIESSTINTADWGGDPGSSVFEQYWLGQGTVTALAGGFTGASGNFELTAVIPEPGTWAAMAATVLGLAFWRARRKRA